ncbi:hypothetical protein GCM10027036_34750 [Flavihumibacter cheonanensis]|uniref:hypothetical protein n=1 Tax=Flavihumibacter cheonanensis TaxID=1442385 RepID=UPI001EF8CBAA|nr:hypothetical protein [Flavihumibacter cheonanensis]
MKKYPLIYKGADFFAFDQPILMATKNTIRCGRVFTGYRKVGKGYLGNIGYCKNKIHKTKCLREP